MAESEGECSFQELHSQLEYEEPVVTSLDYTSATDHSSFPLSSTQEDTAKQSGDAKLMLVFVLLVIFGSGNTVLNKLAAIPMYNYPNFLNLWGTLLYIPLCFGYVWPMTRFGTAITPEQLALPKRPFAIMGALDCMTSMMQTFCAVYLPGTLLVLLPQAAIPMSMFLSRYILGSKYRALQYIGAVVVVMGIVVVLEPVMTGRHNPDYVCQAINVQNDCTVCQVELDESSCLSHRLDNNPVLNLLDFEAYLQNTFQNSTDDDEGQPVCQWVTATSSGDKWLVVIWSLVMIVSCIPMTISSIYKEIALGEEIDPIYLNGWVAVFQFFFSLLLAVPAGLASYPAVAPNNVPENIWDGFKCFLGKGTMKTGCHPDEHCHDQAGLLVNLSLLFNVCMTLCMMYVLKHGSASLLYLALTVMVPIGNLAFSVLPQAATFHVSDILGLLVIMAGLVLYRYADFADDAEEVSMLEEPPSESSNELTQPLLSGEV